MTAKTKMDRQIDHKVMRVIVGLIAFLLAPTVYLLSGSKTDLTSISISYWTDSRDVFVGALCAVGFFLSAYNGAGNGRDWEYVLSRAACVFAICVALFPTQGFGASDVPAAWIVAITDAIRISSEQIHRGASVLLFACLIVMMWLFSNRAKSKGMLGRAWTYRTISGLMVLGIGGILGFGWATGWRYAVLYTEWWGLGWFGVGWFIAGSYRTEELPEKA